MTATLPAIAPRAGLAGWSLFAALIAMAGLPIYIHAPKFYVDSYGVSLAALGGVLALLRLFDVVQDPVLGWLAEVGRAHRALWVAVAAAVMALAMVAPAPGSTPTTKPTTLERTVPHQVWASSFRLKSMRPVCVTRPALLWCSCSISSSSLIENTPMTTTTNWIPSERWMSPPVKR